MKNNFYLTLLICASFLISICSCDSPTSNNIFKTNEIEFNDINQTPGFTWFAPKYNDYEIDSSIIDNLKHIITSEHIFYFFAMPSCNCEHNQDIFPFAVKTLHSAGVSSNQIKFIIVHDKDAEHPYKDIVQLKDLPEIYLIKNNKLHYSIGDTIKTRKSNSNTPSADSSPEQVILEAIAAK